MGNANGREDAARHDDQLGADDGYDGSGIIMADLDTAIDGEDIAHSPPPSPRASHSPLRFKHQMPDAPLPNHDELHIPSPSWMQTSSDYKDSCNEHYIPTVITWSCGGKEVAVEGSWDDWKTRKRLQRSGKDFTIMKVLPSGVYQFRFIVDGQIKHSTDLPWERDESGNAYNILDLQDYVPEDIDSISGFEPPQSPDSSYNNIQFGQEDFAKEPPILPPHLNSTLLNAPTCHMEIPPPHSKPQHVVLNHLYMHRDKNRPSVVALGSTHRFLSKYVTTVLYKSIQR